MPRLLEQQDAVAQDVDEEIAPQPELLVHVLDAMIDEADRGQQRAPGGQLLE